MFQPSIFSCENVCHLKMYLVLQKIRVDFPAIAMLVFSGGIDHVHGLLRFSTFSSWNLYGVCLVITWSNPQKLPWKSPFGTWYHLAIFRGPILSMVTVGDAYGGIWSPPREQEIRIPAESPRNWKPGGTAGAKVIVRELEPFNKQHGNLIVAVRPPPLWKRGFFISCYEGKTTWESTGMSMVLSKWIITPFIILL